MGASTGDRLTALDGHYPGLIKVGKPFEVRCILESQLSLFGFEKFDSDLTAFVYHFVGHIVDLANVVWIRRFSSVSHIARFVEPGVCRFNSRDGCFCAAMVEEMSSC